MKKVTENDTFSDVIRVAQLNVVSTEACIKRQPRAFQKFITFTTFCAGLDNGECVKLIFRHSVEHDTLLSLPLLSLMI